MLVLYPSSPFPLRTSPTASNAVDIVVSHRSAISFNMGNVAWARVRGTQIQVIYLEYPSNFSWPKTPKVSNAAYTTASNVGSRGVKFGGCLMNDGGPYVRVGYGLRMSLILVPVLVTPCTESSPLVSRCCLLVVFEANTLAILLQGQAPLVH
ncbi:hypothetical protein ONZ45_g3897 [Pleurotus djamor]|nr:hypothetical protein ONZ45_g3897 [Pleurotus djamor]